MNAAHTLVRWPRVGNSTQWSRWHISSPIAADARGRTQCGRYFARRGTEHKPYERTDTICLNCLRALGGTVPGEPSS